MSEYTQNKTDKRRRGSRLVALTAPFVFVLASSCGDDQEDTAPPFKEPEIPEVVPNDEAVLTNADAVCPTGTPWTYKNLGEAYLLTNCTSCHSASQAGAARRGAPDHINLDTPADVQIWRTFMIQQISADTMPPSGVTGDSKDAVLEWLNCGAPLDSEEI